MSCCGVCLLCAILHLDVSTLWAIFEYCLFDRMEVRNHIQGSPLRLHLPQHRPTRVHREVRFLRLASSSIISSSETISVCRFEETIRGHMGKSKGAVASATSIAQSGYQESPTSRRSAFGAAWQSLQMLKVALYLLGCPKHTPSSCNYTERASRTGQG